MCIILRAERSAEDGGQKYLQGTWNGDLQGTGCINVYSKQGKLVYRGIRTERIRYREAYRDLRTESCRGFEREICREESSTANYRDTVYREQLKRYSLQGAAREIQSTGKN
jgi:hypothetical protein